MKKLLFLALLLTASIGQTSAIHTIQVTIGAGVTQVSTLELRTHQVIFQNNQTHTMRVGDVNTTSSRGALLAAGSPGGSMNLGPLSYGDGSFNLSQFYVAGTQNDVMDVIYVD